MHVQSQQSNSVQYFSYIILSEFVFIKFPISNISIYSVTYLCSNIGIVYRGVSVPPPPLFYFIPPSPPPPPRKMSPPPLWKMFILPLDAGLFHRCHGYSVISYTCFFFIYVYLLSCCHLPN